MKYQISNKYNALRIAYGKLNRGFTIIELIIYMGILSVLLSILVAVFGSIIEVQLESKATSSVDQDGRYILSRLIYDTQSATEIASPSAGVTGTVLRITKDSENYIYAMDTSGNLQITNNSGTDNLNSVDSMISDLSFLRIGSGTTKDTIQMKFTVTSKTQRTSGPRNETRTYQTTLGLQ